MDNLTPSPISDSLDSFDSWFFGPSSFIHPSSIPAASTIRNSRKKRPASSDARGPAGFRIELLCAIYPTTSGPNHPPWAEPDSASN